MEDNSFENSEIAKKIANYHLPRFNELIGIDLFMNQIIKVLDDYLSPFSLPGDGSVLTPSMINNYVFKHFIGPPKNKKYDKIQLIYLLIIALLKQVISIKEISLILEFQIKQYSDEVAYNYFCEELEKALKTTFEVRDFSVIESSQPQKVTPLTKTVRSAVISFANKVYVRQSLYYEKNLKQS